MQQIKISVAEDFKENTTLFFHFKAQAQIDALLPVDSRHDVVTPHTWRPVFGDTNKLRLTVYLCMNNILKYDLMHRYDHYTEQVSIKKFSI